MTQQIHICQESDSIFHLDSEVIDDDDIIICKLLSLNKSFNSG